MDQRRVGRSLHVLRRARGLTQADVAAAAGSSQPIVSAIEAGRWASTSLRTIQRVFDVLEADVEVTVRYRRGEIDRLLDEGHAAVVISVSRLLREHGWRVEPEVTFNHYGDRGSIDLLAFHPVTRVVLVVEAKTRITSAEETLRRLDVKARLAARLASDRFGGRPAATVRLLAIRASTAERERVIRLDPLFGPAFPCRGRRLGGWLRHPETMPAPAGGLLFVRIIGGVDKPRTGRAARVPRDPGGRGA